MSKVGEYECRTQRQVLRFFQNELRYHYLGHWKDRDGNRTIEEALPRDWLARQGYEERVVNRACASWTRRRRSPVARRSTTPTGPSTRSCVTVSTSSRRCRIRRSRSD